YRAWRQFGKCVVGWRKYRKWSLALQGIHQSSSLHRSHQGSVVGGVCRILDDVFGGKHLTPTNNGILRSGDQRSNRQGRDGRQTKQPLFHFLFSKRWFRFSVDLRPCGTARLVSSEILVGKSSNSPRYSFDLRKSKTPCPT